MSSVRTGAASRLIHRLFDQGSLAGLSDGQLLRRYLDRGDDAAFAALVGRHAGLVRSVCRRCLHDPADLDDASQATFLVLARRPGYVRDPEVLGGWLLGTARRVCRLARTSPGRNGPGRPTPGSGPRWSPWKRDGRRPAWRSSRPDDWSGPGISATLGIGGEGAPR